MNEEKPRVVQILQGFSIEGPGGGANRFGIELAQTLNPEQYRRAVWALWDFGSPAEQERMKQLNDKGIETFVAATWYEDRPYQSWLQAYRSLAKRLKQCPAKIFNSHSEFGDVPVLLFKLLDKKIKIVRTVHGGHFREWDRRPFRRLFLTHILYPLFYDLEFGVSPRVINELNGRLFARQLKKESIFLPNAINLERFTQVKGDILAKRRELKIPDGSFLIGSVGRFTEQKGFVYLIEAATSVISQNPEVCFLLVGDGPLRDALKDKTKKTGITDRFIFAGMQQDIEILYRCLDLFVSSSLWEGLPTVIMESMASGVPVVATNIPGNQDIVRNGDNGWLVSPKQPEVLAAKILAAIRSPNFRQKYALQAQRDIKKYSIQNVAPKYSDFYENLLTTKPRRKENTL